DVAQSGSHPRGVRGEAAAPARHQYRLGRRDRAAHQQRVKRPVMRHVLIITAFFAALIGLWKAGTVFGGWSPVLLPPPEAVAEYLWGAAKDGSLAEASLVTLERLLIGYAIGVVIGLPLGLITSTSDIFQDTIGALALGLQTLPSVCSPSA